MPEPDVDALLSKQREEAKASTGGLVTFVFIFTAIYLFVSTGGLASLFSLRALMFIALGMFVAAVGIGVPMYLLGQGVVKLLRIALQRSARKSGGIASERSLAVFGGMRQRWDC